MIARAHGAARGKRGTCDEQKCPKQGPARRHFHWHLLRVVLIVAGALLDRYFGRRPVPLREAGFVGALWLAINIVCDYPLIAYGPMKMTAPGYYSEIGLVYLTYPIFALLAARLARR